MSISMQMHFPSSYKLNKTILQWYGRSDPKDTLDACRGVGKVAAMIMNVEVCGLEGFSEKKFRPFPTPAPPAPPRSRFFSSSLALQSTFVLKHHLWVMVVCRTSPVLALTGGHFHSVALVGPGCHRPAHGSSAFCE